MQQALVVVGEEPVMDVRAFLALCGSAHPTNMGNKESSVGTFSFNDGIRLCRFPMAEVIKEVFLLYHMNTIPMIIVDRPTNISNAKINLGDIENG